jgi:hypothetical protein
MWSQSRSLLAAADAYPLSGAPENRLTEIFAEVLRSSPGLVDWLFREGTRQLGSQWPVGEISDYDVSTQVGLSGGAQRPDLEIRPSDARWPSLFVESKLYAPFTTAQLSGYPKRTIGIVPADRVPALAPQAAFPLLSWTDVANAIDDIGHGWAGRQWRGEAIAPTAAGEYRLLHELFGYLQAQLQIRVYRPITADDLVVFERAEETLDLWDHLFDLVAEALKPTPGVVKGPERWHTNDPLRPSRSSGWFVVVSNEGVWPALEAAWREQDGTAGWVGFDLILAPEITWAGAPNPTPAFGAGASVMVTPDWPPGLGEGQPFNRLARQRDFSIGTTTKGRVGRIFRTLQVSDLSGVGRTLDEQAEYVAAWASRILAEFRDWPLP